MLGTSRARLRPAECTEVFLCTHILDEREALVVAALDLLLPPQVFVLGGLQTHGDHLRAGQHLDPSAALGNPLFGEDVNAAALNALRADGVPVTMTLLSSRSLSASPLPARTHGTHARPVHAMTAGPNSASWSRVAAGVRYLVVVLENYSI